MVGPSSSHTAGVVRIGNKARELFQKKCTNNLKNVQIYLYGSFAKTYKGHATDVAAVGGILGFETDNLLIKNAFDIAKQQGINVNIIPTDDEIPIDVTLPKGENNPHPNTIKILLENDNNSLIVVGVSIGGGSMKIIGVRSENV